MDGILPYLVVYFLESGEIGAKSSKKKNFVLPYFQDSTNIYCDGSTSKGRIHAS
jgi:hypothetical protein